MFDSSPQQKMEMHVGVLYYAEAHETAEQGPDGLPAYDETVRRVVMPMKELSDKKGATTDRAMSSVAKACKSQLDLMQVTAC